MDLRREDFSIINEADRLDLVGDACPVTRPREINQSVRCVLTREEEREREGGRERVELERIPFLWKFLVIPFRSACPSPFAALSGSTCM